MNFAMPQGAFSAPWRDQLNAPKELIDVQAPQFKAQAGQIADIQNQLNNGIARSNSNGVANLGLAIANAPPRIGGVLPIADKLDELINALRR